MGVADDESKAPDRAVGALARRRAVKSAMALEEAGERTLAARVFEDIGEHHQAAALHLEAAADEHNLAARLELLRAGAARNRGSSAQGRALHRTLARALLMAAQSTPAGLQRRGLMFEAAHALESADEGERAGQIYEELGLMEQAAAAYENAGAIGRLEVALEVIERRRAHGRDTAELAEQIQEASRAGHRALALDMLRRVAASADAATLSMPEGLDFRARLAALEALLPDPARVTLEVRVDGIERTQRVEVLSTDVVSMGRAPDAHIPASGLGTSRQHARVSPSSGGGFTLEDLGSRAGPFVDGVPLDPDRPQRLDPRSEVALGADPPISCVTHTSPRGDVLELTRGDNAWLFAPEGGPLLTSGVPLALDVGATGSFFTVAAVGTDLLLNGVRRPAGCRVEVLRGDRLEVRGRSVSLMVEVCR